MKILNRLLRRLRALTWKKVLITAPVGDSYYGSAAQLYSANRKSQPYWELEDRVIRQAVEGLPNKTRVLDVPFGTGRFVKMYLERGFQVWGLDSSLDMLEAAKGELGDAYHSVIVTAGDALKLPYKKGDFDVVVCMRFLSHILSLRDAATAVKEMSRVCSGAMLLQFRVRNEDAPALSSPDLDKIMGNQLKYSQLVEWLRQLGLEVEKRWDLEQRPDYFRTVLACKAIT